MQISVSVRVNKFHYAILLNFFSFTFVSKLSKLLVVRFSSIGDIVLTSPVVRILKQNQFEVHFLTKKKYAPLLVNNPNIDKLYCFNKTINEAKSEIINENYDFIIDLGYKPLDKVYTSVHQRS